MEAKAKTIYGKLLDLAEKHSDKDAEINLKDHSEYTKEKKKIFDTYYKDVEWFLPQGPIDDFLKYINNMEFVTTSTSVQKLKKIARIIS